MGSEPQILLINGPNLNVLGRREPRIYGSLTLAEVEEVARSAATDAGLVLTCFQSNSEADIVSAVQNSRDVYAGIVINAGALTHSSWALADALSYFGGVVIEVHITNTLAREAWRHISVISPVARGSIQGFGVFGYELAVRAMKELVG